MNANIPNPFQEMAWAIDLSADTTGELTTLKGILEALSKLTREGRLSEVDRVLRQHYARCFYDPNDL